MSITMVLEMAADGFGGRIAIGSRSDGLTYAALLDSSRRAATWIASRDGAHVASLDVNSVAIPMLLFASAYVARPFVPLNYRLADEPLRQVLARTAPAVVVVAPEARARISEVPGLDVHERHSFLTAIHAEHAADAALAEPDDAAILLFTSGTTAEPKIAILRHRHLTSYVMSTIEFGAAAEDDATLISVPPYHVAGIAAILTSVYAGRRIIQLPSFAADEWVAVAAREAVTHAMVVPTMLARILDCIERDGTVLPHLRHLAYGGGSMPAPVIERALAALPHVDFVNAYGLTETSSTIAVLGPADHRAAAGSNDQRVRRRLGSVGRPIPTVELEIRDEIGHPVPPGTRGTVWVRGEQISGEYVGQTATLAYGWFSTRDAGTIDEDGYLFLDGRLDDVIVRGGENLSPSEIEGVLHTHPSVADAAVIGIPDEEWGESPMAFVVPRDGAVVTDAELKQWVSSRLRSSRTPRTIEFMTELPYSETGKLLRRVLKQRVAERG